MSSNNTKRTHAFTLVELLVVIGIIALLISILLPSLNRARAAAKQAVCLSNMRQLANAVFLYAADNKGVLPYFDAKENYYWGWRDTIPGVTGVGTYFAWNYCRVVPISCGPSKYFIGGGYLSKYLHGGAGVYECPTMAGVDLPIDPEKPATTIAATYMAFSAKRLSDLSSTTETVLFGDAILADTTSAMGMKRAISVRRPGLAALYDAQYPGDSFHGRHVNGVGNLAFFDGHAESSPARRVQKNQYDATVTDPVYALMQRNRIGAPSPYEIDQSLTSNAAYRAACANQYDFWFWANKFSKGSPPGR